MAGETEVIDMELTGPVTVTGTAWTDVEAEPHPDTPDQSSRSLAFTVSKPAPLGGDDEGMMPSEYLMAALGSCMLMTMRRVAEKRKVTWDSLGCRVKAHLEGSDIARMELHATVSTEADTKAWETVLRLAGKTCTVSRALSCPLEKTITVTSTSSK